jgi:hypothetical protein
VEMGKKEKGGGAGGWAPHAWAVVAAWATQPPRSGMGGTKPSSPSSHARACGHGKKQRAARELTGGEQGVVGDGGATEAGHGGPGASSVGTSSPTATPFGGDLLADAPVR